MDKKLWEKLFRENKLNEDFNLKFQKQADQDWYKLLKLADDLFDIEKSVKQYSKSSWKKLHNVYTILNKAMDDIGKDWPEEKE